jgi:hypothetical protein
LAKKCLGLAKRLQSAAFEERRPLMEQELLSLVSAAPIMLLLSGNDIFDALRRVIKLTARSPVPHIVIPVLRPEDLLVLLFDCVNFRRNPGTGASPATLTRAVPSQPSYIVVNFQ